MNRKLIVSILAIILAITMILSLVLAALPARIYGNTAVLDMQNIFTAVSSFVLGTAV